MAKLVTDHVQGMLPFEVPEVDRLSIADELAPDLLAAATTFFPQGNTTELIAQYHSCGEPGTLLSGRRGILTALAAKDFSREQLETFKHALLHDPSQDVQLAVIDILANLEPKRVARDTLLEAIEFDQTQGVFPVSTHVAEEVISKLSKLADRDEHLCAELHDRLAILKENQNLPDSTQRAALLAQALIGDVDIIHELPGHLSDRDSSMRIAAAKAFAILAPKKHSLSEELKDSHRACIPLLGAMLTGEMGKGNAENDTALTALRDNFGRSFRHYYDVEHKQRSLDLESSFMIQFLRERGYID